MAYYAVFDIDVHDEEGYKAYTAQTPAAVAKYGGRFLIRNGEKTPLEGNWMPIRFVVVEFPDEATFKAFYADPEYQEILKIRHANATSRSFGIQGHSG